MEKSDLSVIEEKQVVYNKMRVLLTSLIVENENVFNDLVDCNELLFEFLQFGIGADEVFCSKSFSEALQSFIMLKSKLNGLQAFLIKKSII